MPREALEVADVFRHFGPTFRDPNGVSLSAAQRRAMIAIESCRTAALGGHVERCNVAASCSVWRRSSRPIRPQTTAIALRR